MTADEEKLIAAIDNDDWLTARRLVKKNKNLRKLAQSYTREERRSRKPKRGPKDYVTRSVDAIPSGLPTLGKRR